MNKGLWAIMLMGALALAMTGRAQSVKCSETINYDKAKVAYNYDLITLYHTARSHDYLSYFSQATEATYTMNICGESASSCSPSTSSASVCGFSNEFGIMNLGLTNTQEMGVIDNKDVEPGKGVLVKYSKGDVCPDGRHRSSLIQVRCFETTSPYIYDASEDSDYCEVTFFIYAAAGCGTETKYVSKSGGIGAGGIILIM